DAARSRPLGRGITWAMAKTQSRAKPSVIEHGRHNRRRSAAMRTIHNIATTNRPPAKRNSANGCTAPKSHGAAPTMSRTVASIARRDQMESIITELSGGMAIEDHAESFETRGLRVIRVGPVIQEHDRWLLNHRSFAAVEVRVKRLQDVQPILHGIVGGFQRR